MAKKRNSYRCVIVIPKNNVTAVNALFKKHYDDQCNNTFHRKVYINGIHRGYVASVTMQQDHIVKNGNLRILVIADNIPRSATYLWVNNDERNKLRKLAIADGLDLIQYKGDPKDPNRTHGYVRLIDVDKEDQPTVTQIVHHVGGTLRP